MAISGGQPLLSSRGSLGAVDSRFAWLVRRREPFTLTETPGYRRYRIHSLLLLLASAGLLFGCALLLP